MDMDDHQVGRWRGAMKTRSRAGAAYKTPTGEEAAPAALLIFSLPPLCGKSSAGDFQRLRLVFLILGRAPAHRPICAAPGPVPPLPLLL